MILIPAFRAAGIAWLINCVQAAWPGPLLRPKDEERKKFCMSMITRADLEGVTVMGDVVVRIVSLGPGDGLVGDEGCVRSKPCWVVWSQ